MSSELQANDIHDYYLHRTSHTTKIRRQLNSSHSTTEPRCGSDRVVSARFNRYRYSVLKPNEIEHGCYHAYHGWAIRES